MQIRRRRLRLHLAFEAKARLLAPFRRDARQPFTVASVEDEDGVAGPETQDIQEIVRLVPLQRQIRSGGESRIDEQAMAREIGSGHRGSAASFIKKSVESDAKTATFLA
jgi:hypothetical protein